MKLSYPKVHTDSNQKVFVSFFIQEKRFRLYNGKRINTETNPNSFPVNQRKEIGNLLAAEIFNYLNSGGSLSSYRSEKLVIGSRTDKEHLKMALNTKISGPYSDKYKKLLQTIYNTITKIMSGDELTPEHIKTYLNKYSKGMSFNTIRRHINVLINEAVSQGMGSNPDLIVKSRKAKAVLHKPFDDVRLILNDIKEFNKNLYLCCIMTYGCLLRPHREIRELTWGDFTDDLSYINLSGSRNKSGRNRIVPVPSYIKEELSSGETNYNIFSGKNEPHNGDYFNTLWSRYKKQSDLIEEGQTLYSFRHSGAIDIFKRTGSLSKLQKAMGHSSLNVSLTYLRGLEIAELTEEDMPVV